MVPDRSALPAASDVYRLRSAAHDQLRRYPRRSHEDVSPGQVQFSIADQQHQLTVFEAGDDRLRIVFRDATAGVETYGAARFLVLNAPHDGMVDLDFNRAFNPPCAFSEYTTCPLPPRENILPVRISAGEQVPE
ncbi:MAG: DUF1684 domain-containing protein [Oscillochloris sp.]|nr:DUF1684 domain-containing protein [Oscillochloris sp.]